MEGVQLSLGGHPLYGLSQIIIALTIALVMIFRRQGLLGGQEIRLPQLLGRRAVGVTGGRVPPGI